MLKLTLFTLLFFLFSPSVFAETFTVTSNANAGAATLRQALLDAAANGTSEKDLITFNIADLSEAGRTINLSSQLPNVSSNLVIDGSTQSGASFGVSNAKVLLLYNITGATTLSGFLLANVRDVEIYGLYIKNATDYSSTQLDYKWRGFDMRYAQRIRIGAAGRGNVVSGFCDALSADQPNEPGQVDPEMRVQGLTVQNCFLGIEADGKTLSPFNIRSCNLNSLEGNIQLGGNSAEGNIFALGLSIHQANSEGGQLPASVITIKNNNIGVDYHEQNMIPKTSGLSVTTVTPSGQNTLNIEDNVIVAAESYGRSIFIGNSGKRVTILRNYIGTDRTLQKKFLTSGIFIYYAGDVVAIGSSNPADANYITNCNPVTIWPYSWVTVNKNSFFCTVNQQVLHPLPNDSYPFPFVYITEITNNELRGTATPNSIIELFYADQCDTNAPEKYFASVNTDNNGNWIYAGPISGYVIASATKDKSTSDFSSTGIDISKIKVNNTCSGLGSITGAVPHSYTEIAWKDENGNIVGDKPDLVNVPAGKYKLSISYNNKYPATSIFYEVKALTPATFSQNAIKINKSCTDQNNGSIELSISPAPKYYRWVSSNNQNTVATTANLSNVTKGDYELYLTDQNGCEQFFNKYTIDNYTVMSFTTKGKIINSTCGFSNGAIADLQVSNGLAPYTYQWINGKGEQINNTASINGLAPGIYKLIINDATQCGQIEKTFEVQSVNKIISPPMVKPLALCGAGEINYKITNADSTALYRIYADAYTSAPIAESTGGTFHLKITTNASFFVSRFDGICESPRTELKVDIGASAINVTNTITPNGDNINDYWLLKGIENYPKAQVHIFNRDGLMVFRSQGYGKPFDGTSNNQDLPVGAYYYIINLSNSCKVLSGSLTIIR